MDHDINEIIIVDDYDEDGNEYRNATRDHRTGRRPRSPRPSRRPSSRPIVVSSGSRRPSRFGTDSPLVRRDTGSLSTGKLVEAGAQILAAIHPLPNAPVATGELGNDIENLMLYQRALAEHAKRDEQLRTVGSLASKLFA